MASGWLRSRASVRNTSMPSELSMSFRLVLRGKSHSQIHSPHTSSASRPYITGCTANMALRATDATYRATKASRHRHAGDFRIYNKLSQASRGFPKKVSLSITRNVSLVVKQVGGPLRKEAYVPEHQFVKEEDEIPTSEAALAPLTPELQPVAMDDNLPQGNSDEAIQEFDSNYDSIDCFNSGLEDFDPAQDSTDYSPSSDETLEPSNAFGLGESSVFLTTPLWVQLPPNEDGNESKTSNARPSDRASNLKLTLL